MHYNSACAYLHKHQSRNEFCTMDYANMSVIFLDWLDKIW